MKIRINNIECRPTPVNSSYEYEILQWYPNDYYGREHEMISDGWSHEDIKEGEWRLTKGQTSVHSSCFKNPESCLVVAWLIPNRREPDIDMQTVGSRVLNLSESDRHDFFKVYGIAHETIMDKLNKED